MHDRAKHGIDPDSPWAKANRRPSRARAFLGKLLFGAFFTAVAALFCWAVLQEDPRPRRGRSSAAPVTRSDEPPPDWSDSSSAQASQAMESVQRVRARGQAFGVVDGQYRELTGDELAAMRQASEIRDQLNSLRDAYRTHRQVVGAAPKNVSLDVLAKNFEASKGRAIAALRRYPSDTVAKGIEDYRKFLGTDEQMLALYGEVERAVRN